MNAAPPRATTRSWFGLGVLVLPLLLIGIDATVLILALPQISADLRPSGAEQLWMIDIYSLMLAGLLVTMTSIGERFGRRRVLLIGAVFFTIASVMGALSTTPLVLILSRAVLGIAGATIMPSTLSLIRNMFLDREQRRFAMAVWGAMASVGAAAGPIVGGWIIEHFSWQAAFLMNIPIMLLLLVLGPFVLPESKNPDLRRIDLLSVGVSLVSMLALVYGIKSVAGGKDVPLGIAALLLAAVGFWIFVRRQLALPTPLIDVRLFRRRHFRGAVVGDLLSIFALVGALVALTQYMQLVLGLGPLESALWLLPQAAIAAVAAFIAAALVKRIAPVVVVSIGLGVATTGFLVLLSLTPHSHPAVVAAALCLISLGAGVGMTLTNDIIMSSVPPERAGQAAATSETAYELGTTLGTAVLGSVLVAWYANAVAGARELANVPADLLSRAESTIAEATLVAREIGGATGELLLSTAQAAFTEGIVITGAVGAGIMGLAVAWAAWTLRGASATKDLSVEHDH
ncbi:MFS transporter [Microbacterium sp. NPDC008134]|uniref:MFS transporter n=1 Tax=Microbacterium sp. NPDC008134 TaxID=3364183 RepID=UPI0036E38159